ncbi:3-oxo-5-alpha-steroid 4-dehydrogenase 2, partial [Silurus meridionalis]
RMQCMEKSLCFLNWGLIIGGVLYFLRQVKTHTQYGRYVETGAPGVMLPAKVAWFIQELPSVLVPVLLLLSTDTLQGLGRSVFLWTFCLHYFQRTFIYSLLNKGRPCPLFIMVSAVVFCSLNGFLQGHYMLHCARFDADWHTDIRFISGLFMFFSGMAINIHSDYILRNLRKPGEITYKIPEGGMFEWVSGANFFGEILEWCGYAMATWSLTTFSFAFFTMCSIGPRAYHHHRFYLKKFDNYPKSRKAVIPFLL